MPEAIKSSGKLIVGVNIPYAPNEFKDPSGKIVGFDVDLMNAIAATLGLTAEYREADFAKIIPSIQGDTFNVGMSSFTDTKEREQTVDFVTYFSAGILWAQRPGKPIDPNNACGKKVAVQATTTEEVDELPAKSKACTDAGKPPIDILKFDGQDAATNAVVLGQADAMSADSPVTAYAIKQSNGKLEAAGEIADAAPYGWPVKKGSPLAQSLQAGPRAPDRERHLQDDRDQLGCRDRDDRQAGHQRRDQLGSRIPTMTDVDTPPATISSRDRCRSAASSVAVGGGGRHHHPGRRCSSTARPPTLPTDGTSSRSTSSTSGCYVRCLEHFAADHLLDGAGDRRSACILAVMRLSPNPVFKSVSWVYLWIFRGTPIYVQLVFWGLIPTIYANIQLGVPFGPSFFHLNLQALSIPFLLAILGLALNEAAYMAEIIRAGISSVPEGQLGGFDGAGHVVGDGDAPHRAPAGDAGDHPADRQRGHQHAEDHIAGHRRAVRA